MAEVEVPSSAERDAESTQEAPEEPPSEEPNTQELAEAFESGGQPDSEEAMYSREGRRRLLSPPGFRTCVVMGGQLSNSRGVEPASQLPKQPLAGPSVSFLTCHLHRGDRVS